MEIIVRDNSPRSMMRVELSSKIKKTGKDLANKSGYKSIQEAYKFLFPDKFVTTIDNINNLLGAINTAKSYDVLPDIIQFNYSELQEENISLNELSSSINFSYKMTCRRLREKPKHVILTGRVSSPISYNFKEDLEKNNFSGSIEAAVSTRSLEKTRDNFADWNKDHGFWDKQTFQNKIVTKDTDPFNLTFRQEQILQLIKTRGLSNQQIANMLKISESTVKMHVGLILKKYGFKTRMQLVTNTY